MPKIIENNNDIFYVLKILFHLTNNYMYNFKMEIEKFYKKVEIYGIIGNKHICNN